MSISVAPARPKKAIRLVRSAFREDFPSIMELARFFWAEESGYREPFEEGFATQMLELSHEHELLVVLEVQGMVVGFAGAIKFPLLGSGSTTVATELAYYIHKRHRGHGISLLKGLERAARAAGVKYLNMIALQHKRPEAVGAIYKRLGYTLTETNWRKELKQWRLPQ